MKHHLADYMAVISDIEKAVELLTPVTAEQEFVKSQIQTITTLLLANAKNYLAIIANDSGPIDPKLQELLKGATEDLNNVIKTLK